MFSIGVVRVRSKVKTYGICDLNVALGKVYANA
jgi:hypothetical protein